MMAANNTTFSSYADDFEALDETTVIPAVIEQPHRPRTPPPGPASKVTAKSNVRRLKPLPAPHPSPARLGSAGASKVAQLVNTLAVRDGELEQLRHENKTLTMVQRRLERALEKFEGVDSDVGLMLQRKDEEIRVLREFLRVLKDKHKGSLGELKRLTSQLLEASEKVADLERLVATKDLKERAVLDAAAEKLRLQLAEKEELVAKLERKLVLDEKERVREWKQRPSDATAIAGLTDQVARLSEKLEAKEKQLARTNMAIAAAVVAQHDRAPRGGLAHSPTTEDAPVSPTKGNTISLPVSKRTPKSSTAVLPSPSRGEGIQSKSPVPSAELTSQAKQRFEDDEKQQAAKAASNAAAATVAAAAAAAAQRKKLVDEEEAEVQAMAQRRRQRQMEAEEDEQRALARRLQLEAEHETARAAQAAVDEERRLEQRRQEEMLARQQRDQEEEQRRQVAKAEELKSAAMEQQRQELAAAAVKEQQEQERKLKEQQDVEAMVISEAGRQKKELLLARMKAIDEASVVPSAVIAQAVPLAHEAAVDTAPVWLASAPPSTSAPLVAAFLPTGELAAPRRGSLAFENLHRGLPAEGRRAGSGTSLASSKGAGAESAHLPPAAAAVGVSPLAPRRRPVPVASDAAMPASDSAAAGGTGALLSQAPRSSITNSTSDSLLLRESTSGPAVSLNTKMPLPSIVPPPTVAVVVSDDDAAGKPLGLVVSPRSIASSQFPWAAKSNALVRSENDDARVTPTAVSAAPDLPTFKRASRVRGAGGGALVGVQAQKRPLPAPAAAHPADTHVEAERHPAVSDLAATRVIMRQDMAVHVGSVSSAGHSRSQRHEVVNDDDGLEEINC